MINSPARGLSYHLQQSDQLAMAETATVQQALSGSPNVSKQGKRKAPSDAPATTKKTKSASTSAKKRGRPAANNGFGSGKKAIENVHKLLSDLGVENPKDVSCCLKAGILNGCITLKRPEDDPEGEYGLDQTLTTVDCLCCDEGDMECTIRQILYQPDYGGGDYEDGGEEAPFKCANEDCGLGIYITGICGGSPEYDSGKFHNHCKECPLFGVCIGDYREVHCYNCGDHYFAGGMGGSCYNCKGKGSKKKAGGEGEGSQRWREEAMGLDKNLEACLKLCCHQDLQLSCSVINYQKPGLRYHLS